MPNKDILEKMQQQFPDAGLLPEESFGQLTVTVNAVYIVRLLDFLLTEPALAFDFLMDLFGVDYLEMNMPERFAVVYNLYSMTHSHRLFVKALIAEQSAELDSVTSVFPAANWAEREVFDQYGIRFTHHPDLRRIINPDDFQGYPLRKDFPTEGIGYRDQFEKITRATAQ